MIRALFLLFIPLPPAHWAIPVLQELREIVTNATELVAEIGVRFKSGDAVPELVAQLESRLAVLAQQSVAAPELPPDMRDEIAALLARVQDTVTVGDEWIAQTGPELATQYARHRLRRTYGVT